MSSHGSPWPPTSCRLSESQTCGREPATEQSRLRDTRKSASLEAPQPPLPTAQGRGKQDCWCNSRQARGPCLPWQRVAHLHIGSVEIPERGQGRGQPLGAVPDPQGLQVAWRYSRLLAEALGKNSSKSASTSPLPHAAWVWSGWRSPLNTRQRLCAQERLEPVSIPLQKPRVKEPACLCYINCPPGGKDGSWRKSFSL